MKTDSVSLKQTEALIGYALPNPGWGLESGLQLANDGKIYGTKSGVDSLCCIEYPNIQGTGCSFVSGIISLQGRLSGETLPQFIQRYKAYIYSLGNCQHSPVHFAGDIWPPPDTTRWNFGDPASGTMNISYDTTPSHMYALPGLYTVELYVRHNDNRTDTSWVTIEILPAPGVDIGPDTTICQDDSVTFDAGYCSGCTYSWDNLSTGQLHIGAGQTYRTGEEGLYAVTVTAPNGCQGRDTIQLTVITEVSVSATPSSLTLCSGDTTEIFLQGSLPGCSFSWMAGASSDSLSGYSNGSGPSIIQPLINTDTLVQTVTYTIMPSLYGCLGVPLVYPVPVHPLLPVSISITADLNPVCQGLPVNLTGIPINGGSAPLFQWQVNGIPVGLNQPTYSYTPVHGDGITCTLTSSESCTSGNPATSNPVSMIVVEAPQVTFTPCFDTITTTNAKPILLRGGIPLGGTFSGPGVTAQPAGGGGGSGMMYYFNPSLAGPGLHEITYNYINSAGCKDSSKIFIINYQLSIINCGDSLTDIRDNQKYPTVQIGAQCWMAANLNYGTMIPFSTAQRDNCIPEKYLQPPPGLPQPGEGSVYQWDELMCYSDSEETQGLCPPGWHVPSEADWNQLFAVYLGNAFAGSPLLMTGYSGFDAQLIGIDAFNQSWHFDGFATLFWSSTAHGPWKAWAHGMNDYNYSVSFYPAYRANAFSVRCVRD